jgi:hypothetical protein
LSPIVARRWEHFHSAVEIEAWRQEHSPLCIGTSVRHWHSLLPMLQSTLSELNQQSFEPPREKRFSGQAHRLCFQL